MLDTPSSAAPTADAVSNSAVFKYTAEPTLVKFHRSKKRVRYIKGPWGSGKSTGCVFEILMRAMRQQPKNGVRRSRWAIIRNTYPELKSTTIKTWERWVPTSVAPVVMSTPISCKFRQKLADGTVMDLEVIFMALDGPEDVKKLLSLELTGAYINEGREVSWEVFEGVMGRIDRYPETEKDADGNVIYGPTEPGVLVDSNAPRTSHWLYEKFETGEVPDDWEMFPQPPAVYFDVEADKWVLNPDAENLSHLPTGYYAHQMTLGEEHIRVNLACEPGMTRKGKPVFHKFSNVRHVAKEVLLPKRGSAILVGIDFGLTPAAILGQLNFKGLTLLDELPATDESLEDFLDQYLLPLLRSKYNGYPVVACGDPAGKGRSSINKMTSLMVMNQRGIKTYPAITNAFGRRKEAVDWFLGRDEGFVVSPHLTFTREALSAGYVWKEVRNNSGQTLDIADKNEYSHIADAVEYLALYARYGGGSLSKPDMGMTAQSGSPKGGQKKRKWA